MLSAIECDEAFVCWQEDEGYDEYSALEYFFNNREKAGLPKGIVRLRPHPSDRVGKYDEILDRFQGQIELSIGTRLVDDIIDAEIVVGCESMALLIGLIANKRVISCIPPGGRPCTLPLKNIESFANLVQSSV